MRANLIGVKTAKLRTREPGRKDMEHRSLNLYIREKDEAIIEEARKELERDYSSLSVLLVKAAKEYLERKKK